MLFKSIKKNLYMEPMSIIGESVGTGDGTSTVFTLDYINPRDGTVVVYLDSVITTDYVLTASTGEITLNTAPTNGTVVTADYDLGVDDLVLTPTTSTTIIGLQIANIHSTDAGAVTIKINDIYISNAIPIPINSTLSPMLGKLVLEAGDELHIFASDNDMLDLVVSYME